VWNLSNFSLYSKVVGSVKRLQKRFIMIGTLK
jgi:hypothetical protein